jgi:excisionase family DNA binding protein
MRRTDDTPRSETLERLLLTTEEAALVLGISRAKLYPMLMRKEIPSLRIGGLRRVPVSALQRYVEERLIA